MRRRIRRSSIGIAIGMIASTMDALRRQPVFTMRMEAARGREMQSRGA
jgi:hypothetical protein